MLYLILDLIIIDLIFSAPKFKNSTIVVIGLGKTLYRMSDD
jgi:hypothetical protein